MTGCETGSAGSENPAWLSEWWNLVRPLAGTATDLLSTLPQPGGHPALYWQRDGSGTPVLLIMGLGLSAGAWWRTVPVLAQSHEVITFDSRSVGRSQTRVHAFSTSVMADDAIGVLDAAGIGRAHIYGISLGGMVAQQVALRHPDRVRSLVLGATHAGGRLAEQPGPEVLAFLHRRLWLGHEEAARASIEFNYSVRCRHEHADRINEDIDQRLAHRFAAGAYWAQMWAASTHDTAGKLDRIAAPTLVIHGDEDRMIPARNGRLLADRIPGARLLELAGVGHLYPTEAPAVDEQIAAFMAEHD
jgi:pimeloyl-ACP methyl ester carboxylesterase